MNVHVLPMLKLVKWASVTKQTHSILFTLQINEQLNNQQKEKRLRWKQHKQHCWFACGEDGIYEEGSQVWEVKTQPPESLMIWGGLEVVLGESQ